MQINVMWLDTWAMTGEVRDFIPCKQDPRSRILRENLIHGNDAQGLVVEQGRDQLPLDLGLAKDAPLVVGEPVQPRDLEHDLVGHKDSALGSAAGSGVAKLDRRELPPAPGLRISRAGVSQLDAAGEGLVAAGGSDGRGA